MDDTAPPIQFTRTSDGVRIAYWRIGAGRPIVQLPALPYTHVEIEWRIPELRRSYELLALRRSLIRYDSRGLGLSTGGTSDFSLDALVKDLEAIVDVAGGPAALIASINACPVAIRFAAQHPEKVSHLLLWCPLAQGKTDLESDHLKPIIWLFLNDWDLYVKTMAYAFLGWDEPEAAELFSEFIRASATKENARLFFDTMHEEYDVLDLLPKIDVPTLVMHRPGYPFTKPGAIEDIASRIPNCELVLFEGNSAVPYLGDWRAIARTIYGFLGETSDAVAAAMGRKRSLLVFSRSFLTDRERQIVSLIVRGRTNRQIAAELYLSEKTVENHVTRILGKLDLSSRTQLAAYAVEHGLHRRSA